jgi:hypothetical protein
MDSMVSRMQSDSALTLPRLSSGHRQLRVKQLAEFRRPDLNFIDLNPFTFIGEGEIGLVKHGGKLRHAWTEMLRELTKYQRLGDSVGGDQAGSIGCLQTILAWHRPCK